MTAMNLLFEQVALLGHDLTELFYVATDGERIASVTKTRPKGAFDRVIGGKRRLLTPGLVNAHTHSAMTIFRGYGEDLPLSRWLEERIFPAEDRLTDEAVYLGSKLAVAEMIASGVTSFSDMYFFCDATARAVLETGIKANISRSIVSFDPDADPKKDPRLLESYALFREWNGEGNGRLLVDLSLHAEYTNLAPMVSEVAEGASSLGTRVQIHLSETEKEHEECKIRNGGKTPTEFFRDLGLFSVPVVCAHGVYLTEGDREILREASATVVHNPVSNLKLGSGAMPLGKTLESGVRVALGTDGAASNNRLDVLREMQLALLLQKGASRKPDSILAGEGVTLASENGALSQGRPDTGKIEVGYRADLALFDLEGPRHLPALGASDTLFAYSLAASDVSMTVADGRILYENGEFKTLDVEKLKSEFGRMRENYFA